MHFYEKKVFIMFTLMLVTIYMTCYNEFKPVPLGFCLYSVYALNAPCIAVKRNDRNREEEVEKGKRGSFEIRS